MKMNHSLISFFATAILLVSCKKDFVPSIEERLQETAPSVCSPLRTQTPGGWGSTPRGNNPGTYLHNNFAAAFGTLTIGCVQGKTLTVTSAAAITRLLPTGGKAAVLSMNAINPTAIKNVLVGHLIALTLSVGFDTHDPNFAAAPASLGDMIVGSGTFSGMTVNDFMDIANDVIGGCNSIYSIQDVLTTATLINENYVDGTMDNGFLTCPDNTPR